ncbi:DUF2911 domain-containing protein [Maribacter algicola]|uniref:DUF2911 domain-containing protein n=1 Tax=Meishania litoralis TaxID=3434685 RepID=A0ACC7LJ23_9FLAO
MKFLKWFLIVIVALALLFFTVGKPYLQEQTKKHSPEKVSTYTKNGMDLAVKYSSPFKKGRVIFGELVPYNTIWRTGANEPTTFTTETDIKISGNELPTGTYSIWTKPNAESWVVMFNKEVPEWGVTLLSGGKETTRNPEQDVVTVEVPAEKLASPQESFLIDFEDSDKTYLTLSWDETKVKVPIEN